MEKLELKHLAPYLPYGLNIETKWRNPVTQTTKIGIESMTLNNLLLLGDIQMKSFKPILRPLSDLKKGIEIDSVKIYPLSENNIGAYYSEYPDEFIDSIADKCIEYIYLIKLIECHFDVFGLIEKGLAIDINTIK